MFANLEKFRQNSPKILGIFLLVKLVLVKLSFLKIKFLVDWCKNKTILRQLKGANFQNSLPLRANHGRPSGDT